jgi:3-hydroxyacyl-CoA dehydrogenase
MPSTKAITRIAIVGSGVIGASWAAYYLARSFDVVATLSDRSLECLFHDPGPRANR